ncbi:5'-3' exonuclease H3TH domain-containing protein [Marinomonas sp. RSW2]|uniref:5'-3' exonuclease H3TH domain-containing protein n=1 Tax=Marinomonas maritima TaxID=2940935 RepID=A0ABT5WCB4_9GAMM|nr:5'-3' exonuclease H3TH domain-containing protein [Marinomonas maritima]MDE8602357.1 5'-3' exonuclease H3TH domain-containing protein [Marinomonas maritima]
MDKKLLIIDGLNLIRRFYAALESEQDLARRVERAQSITIEALVKLALQFNPSYAVIVFDSNGKTWRHNLYPEYKLGRVPMDDLLLESLPDFAKLFRFNHFPCLRLDGWEADDLIATLAVKAAKNNVTSYIVSTDKGFTQLLGDERILQYDYFAKLGYDKIWVPGKYGVEPHQLVDYWALVGDTTNRVPGVKGIGPKTALTIINAFPTIEEIYANVSFFSERIQTMLAGGYEQCLQSRSLVALKTDVDVGVRLSQLRYTPKTVS